jgi:hypothetical protein
VLPVFPGLRQSSSADTELKTLVARPSCRLVAHQRLAQRRQFLAKFIRANFSFIQVAASASDIALPDIVGAITATSRASPSPVCAPPPPWHDSGTWQSSARSP